MNTETSSIKIDMPDNVKMILDRLSAAGYEAVIVGGCVRDSIMGLDPHDWDIATSAKPKEIMELFDKYNLMTAGLKHGTVTIIIDHTPYEVTTYRIDGKYTDFRRPDKVDFTDDLKEDIMRRDFTINAIAYDGKNIIDYCGGIDDIVSGKICCVGNPNDRFQEDPLRILRAIRFSLRFGFDIEFATVIGMVANMDLLEKIAIERKQNEFSKAIMYNDLDLLFEFKDIIGYVIPNLDLISNKEWFDIVALLSKSNELCEKLAIIVDGMGIIGYNNIIKLLSESMKYPNKIVKSVCNIIEGKKLLITDSEICMKELLFKYPFDDVMHILNFKEAKIKYRYNKEYISKFENAKIICRDILDNKECYNLKGLAVNGRDLKEIGIDDLEMKQYLTGLLQLVITGQVKNTKESLIEVVKISRL